MKALSAAAAVNVAVGSLARDLPDSRRASIETAADTLNVSCRRACNAWVKNRDGAPFAWVAAPAGEAWDCCVDARLRAGCGAEVIGLFTVFDGDGGHAGWSFGPRTWSVEGVGYQTHDLQDYDGGDGKHRLGMSPWSWTELRMRTTDGGRTFELSAREAPIGVPAEARDAWQTVRQSAVPFGGIRSSRIGLGLKTGKKHGNATIEYRALNLVDRTPMEGMQAPMEGMQADVPMEGMQLWLDAKDASSMDVQVGGSNGIREWRSKGTCPVSRILQSDGSHGYPIVHQKAVLFPGGAEGETMPSVYFSRDNSASIKPALSRVATIVSVASFASDPHSVAQHYFFTGSGQSPFHGDKMMITSGHGAWHGAGGIHFHNGQIRINTAEARPIKEVACADIGLDTKVGLAVATCADTVTNSSGMERIGRDRQGGQDGKGYHEYKGHICELLVYDRPLSKEEVAAVEGYLQHKWLLPPQAAASQIDVSTKARYQTGRLQGANARYQIDFTVPPLLGWAAICGKHGKLSSDRRTATYTGHPMRGLWYSQATEVVERACCFLLSTDDQNQPTSLHVGVVPTESDWASNQGWKVNSLHTPSRDPSHTSILCLSSRLLGNPLQIGYVCRSDGVTVNDGSMGIATRSPFRNRSTVAVAIEPPRDRGGKATARVIVGDRVVLARRSNEHILRCCHLSTVPAPHRCFCPTMLRWSCSSRPARSRTRLLRPTRLRLCLPECSCCRCSAVRGST